MPTELAYLNQPDVVEFDAQIVRRVSLEKGQPGVILAATYFYPTGGGQSHDTGILGGARVLDVFKDDQGDVVHVLDREISGNQAQAQIDRERRLGNMQHHSGQHVLSQAIQDELGLETVSVKISTDRPSTIDVVAEEIHQADLERAEDLANRIVFEDRPIKSYFITDREIHTVPLRRSPAVEGRIRVVEIEDFDYSACGGTHCIRTGMIGPIKIVRVEHRGSKQRLHFAAGQQALGLLHRYHAIV